MKIENQSHKRSHKLDGIGVRRIRTFPFSSDSAYDSVAYDLVETILSEWEVRSNHNASSQVLRVPFDNIAASLDEKIAEAVRRFPVLYDKSCKDFEDTNKQKNAWEDVSKVVGLSSGMLNYRSETSPSERTVTQRVTVLKDPFPFLSCGVLT